MKRLFWILLVLNLIVFAYFKRDALSPAVSSLKPEVHPEQIKLLSDTALETYSKRTVAPAQDTSLIASPPPVETAASNTTNSQARVADKKDPVKAAEIRPTAPGVCYEWSSFNSARVNEAVNLAQQLNIKTQVGQTVYGPENIRYWIYKPPMASVEAAQSKADELLNLGVEDFLIVQDDPKWRNAISFGVFRDEKLADKLMEDLKAKGVRLLMKSTRNGGQGQSVIKLQHVNAQQFSGLQKAQSQFPDAVLKEIPCQ